MIFLLAYMFLFFGIFIAGVLGLLPLSAQFGVPDYFRFILFMVGMIIAYVGLIMLHGRAVKTGVHHFIEPGRPNKIIWFYVFRDGTIKVTPSMREVEGQLYNKELDAQIQDMKSYRLFDHPVRFVPEGVGHAVDLGMCLYAQFLKTKHGFNSLKEAREGGFGFSKPILSQEYIEEEESYE